MNILRNISLDKDKVVISFDTTSLYLDIPVKAAVNEAGEKLIYSRKYTMLLADRETFIILAELTTTNVVILTHDEFYCQIDGIAMVYRRDPTLSNIWLLKYETNIRDNTKAFERYMDNALEQQFIQIKLMEINALQPNLKNTLDVEVEGKLLFLDLTINHLNYHLALKIY